MVPLDSSTFLLLVDKALNGMIFFSSPLILLITLILTKYVMSDDLPKHLSGSEVLQASFQDDSDGDLEFLG